MQSTRIPPPIEAAFFESAFLFRYDTLRRGAPTLVRALGEVGVGLLDIYLGLRGT